MGHVVGRNHPPLAEVWGLVAQTALEQAGAMKREDIIRDIHGLESELAALEDRYGLLSSDFYHCYRAGELE